MRVEIFKCRSCKGDGLFRPKNPERPKMACVSCGGKGKLRREINETEEKMAHMSRIGNEYRWKRSQ